MCECNCHVEHDKPISKDATKLEEILLDRMLKEASPVFFKFLDDALSKDFDHRTDMRPEAR